MGKIVCILFLLCTVVGGALWFKKQRPRTQLVEDIETFVTQFLDEASETLFSEAQHLPIQKRSAVSRTRLTENCSAWMPTDSRLLEEQSVSQASSN